MASNDFATDLHQNEATEIKQNIPSGCGWDEPSEKLQLVGKLQHREHWGSKSVCRQGPSFTDKDLGLGTGAPRLCHPAQSQKDAV